MNQIIIDQNQTFKQMVDNITTLKSQYREILASFSYKQLKEQNSFVYNIRCQIYSFSFEEWKKDKLWEYLNNDIELEVIKQLTK